MKAHVLTLLLIALPAWAGTQTVTLYVPGMSCAACPITIKKALMRVEGVEAVDASYESRTAVVSFDDAVTSAEAVRQATGNVGYPSTIRVGK